MAETAARIESSKGGAFVLLDDGSILAEGSYSVLNDHTLTKGSENIRIGSKDILCVGERSYSPVKFLIWGTGIGAADIIVYNAVGGLLYGAFGHAAGTLFFILLIVALMILIKYWFGHKKFLEVNTIYGSFCLDTSGMSSESMDNFIRTVNEIRRRSE